MEEQVWWITRNDPRSQHQADNEFTSIRRWYFTLPSEKRAKLKRQVSHLMDLAMEIFTDWRIFVRIQFAHWRETKWRGKPFPQLGIDIQLHELFGAILYWNESEKFFDSTEADG